MPLHRWAFRSHQVLGGSLYYLSPKFQYSVPSSTLATPYLAFIGLVPSLILSPISPIMFKFQELCFFLLYCQIIPQSRAWVSCGNLLWGSGHSGSLLGWLCIFLSSLLISIIYMGTTWFFARFLTLLDPHGMPCILYRHPSRHPVSLAFTTHLALMKHTAAPPLASGTWRRKLALHLHWGRWYSLSVICQGLHRVLR